MKQSAELREFTLRMYQAMETADMNFIRAHTSQEEGVLSIGTDPSEWWDSYKVITEVYEVQLGEMEGVSIEGANPQAFTEGNVGWVADQVKFKLPDGNTISLRMTSVFHKEANEWKIVQAHSSFGVPNEQSLGFELTTE